LAVDSVDLEDLNHVSGNDLSNEDSHSWLVVLGVGGKKVSVDSNLDSDGGSIDDVVNDSLVSEEVLSGSGKLDLAGSSDVEDNLGIRVAVVDRVPSDGGEVSSGNLNSP